jgi:hypothetical protein
MSLLRHTSRKLLAGLRDHARQALACAMLLSFLLANFGYPVWTPVIGKGNIPFPCQFSQCGCKTLEQCRQGCCCHTKQEKFVWAVERGIDPDRVALLTPEEKFRFAAATSAKPAKKSTCCQSATKASCCDAKREPAIEESEELRWVLSIAARKCHGNGVDWIQADFLAAPPRPVSFVVDVPEAVIPTARRLIHSASAAEALFRPV